MARQNIAYLVSDEWNAQRRHRPNDHYLRTAKAFLETYYTPPLGNYRIVYVNTLKEIVGDLSQRFQRGDDKVGNVTVVLHGALDPRAAARERERIALPIEGRIPRPLSAQELQDELANLGDTLNQAAGTRRALADLRGQRFDAGSTLTFMGCFFGGQQGILDAFREFFGGNLTVFAPKQYQGFTMKKPAGGAGRQNVGQWIQELAGMGLLQVPSDALFRALGSQVLNSTVLRRLGEVMFTPQSDFVPSSLLDLGYVPVMYLLPLNAPTNVSELRTYPQDQQVGVDWGVSQPPGGRQTLVQLQNRFRQNLPGKLEPVSSVHWGGTAATLIQQRRPGGQQGPATQGPQPATGNLAGVRPFRVVPGQPNPIQAQMARQRQAEEARRRAAEDASRRAREEAARRTHEEALRRSREDAARRAREEAARRARAEAENRAREEAARRAREEAARRAREEAARRAREEAQRRALAQQLARIRAPIRSTVRPEFWPRPKPKPPKPPTVTVEFGPVTITRITPPKPRTPPYVAIGGPVTITQPKRPTQTINIPGKWYIKK